MLGCPPITPGGWAAEPKLIVTTVLRSVVRHAGLDAVRAHWPGTDDGFAAVARLTGLRHATPPEEPRAA